MTGKSDLTVDKSFLKRNEFADAVKSGVSFFEDYKIPLTLLIVTALLLIFGIPAYRYYRGNRIANLNIRLYEAQKGLKKEQAYSDILRDFSGIPATKLAHLKLADHYAGNQETDKALFTLDQGLADAQPDVLGTLLVLKKLDILRSQGEAKAAAQFAGESGGKVLPTFRGRLKLIQAESLLDAGDKAAAKAVYESLTQSIAELAEGSEASTGGFDPEIVSEAKEQLLLLNLGQL